MTTQEKARELEQELMRWLEMLKTEKREFARAVDLLGARGGGLYRETMAGALRHASRTFQQIAEQMSALQPKISAVLEVVKAELAAQPRYNL